MNAFCRCFAGCLLLSIITARAEEDGAGHYAPGSFASFVDVLPDKPGFPVFNYFVYYNGNANATRQIPIARQIALNVDATAYTDSVGGFWVTPLKILGGNFDTGAAVPFVWNEVSAKVQVGGNSVRRTVSIDLQWKELGEQDPKIDR